MINNTPLISVIVPVYNEELYLKRCVDSLLNQTYKNLQIILIDDGSTDKSCSMCDDFAEQEARIEVVHTEHICTSYVRNVALENVRGEYVGFVDADDWCDNKMYENLLNLLYKYDADIARCNMWLVKEDHNEKKVISGENEKVCNFSGAVKDVINAVKGESYGPSLQNSIFKTELFRQPSFVYFDTSIIYGEDKDWFFKILKRVNKVAYTLDCYYFYNRISLSSTCDNMVDYKDLLDNFIASIDYVENNNLPYKKLLEQHEIFATYSDFDEIEYYIQGNEQPYKRYLKRSLLKSFLDEKTPQILPKIKIVVCLMMARIKMPRKLVKWVWGISRHSAQ